MKLEFGLNFVSCFKFLVEKDGYGKIRRVPANL